MENVVKALFGEEFGIVGQHSLQRVLLAFFVDIEVAKCDGALLSVDQVSYLELGREVFLELWDQHL